MFVTLFNDCIIIYKTLQDHFFYLVHRGSGGPEFWNSEIRKCCTFHFAHELAETEPGRAQRGKFLWWLFIWSKAVTKGFYKEEWARAARKNFYKAFYKEKSNYKEIYTARAARGKYFHPLHYPLLAGGNTCGWRSRNRKTLHFAPVTLVFCCYTR